MAFKDNGETVLVEYDGDEHYRDSLKIKADAHKASLAITHGTRLVRVPYWAQLTNQTARHYFGLEAEIEQSFPHGFITTKLFPASFCEMGVERFRRELGDGNRDGDANRDAIRMTAIGCSGSWAN